MINAEIRTATSGDESKLLSMDHLASREPDRAAFISESIGSRVCLVAEKSGETCGYGIMDHSFFGRAFIALLYVRGDLRRSGIGTALTRSMEQGAHSTRIFTSTNASNLRMQAFLAKLGYRLTGYVDNLDEGDPELFFFKDLDRGTRLA